jgi:hypothetical protein
VSWRSGPTRGLSPLKGDGRAPHNDDGWLSVPGVAGGAPGGKGERSVHNGEEDTACGAIALESEAFLLGRLVEYRDEQGMEVPVWAWMNLLAHGTARQIGECVLRRDGSRRTGRSWRVARSYLALDVLDLTDSEFTLGDCSRRS